MSSLAQERCANHLSREAAARCPECRRFFCRECVTEHQGRMMCTVCVARLASSPGALASRATTWWALSAGGLTLAWVVFYYLGISLARIPSTFHGGQP